MIQYVEELLRDALRLLPDPFPTDTTPVDQAGIREVLGAQTAAWVRLFLSLLGDRSHPVVAVDTVGGTFSFDRGGLYLISGAFDLRYSTGNDGHYTILSFTRDAATGRVTARVAEPILSAVADGRIVAHALQELEKNLHHVLTARWLATAVGAQLDGLGELLGLRRTSAVDEDYRTALRLQVGVNLAKGTAEEIITVADFPTAVTKVYLLEPGNATILLDLFGSILTPADRAQIRAMKAAGVRMLIGSSAADTPFGFGAEVDAGGADTAFTDPDVGGFSESFAISAVTPGGAGAASFQLAGDLTAVFAAANKVRATGSAPWAGAPGTVYTVSSVVLEAGPNTRLNVAEAVAAGAIGDSDLGLELTHLTEGSPAHSRIGSFFEDLDP